MPFPNSDPGVSEKQNEERNINIDNPNRVIPSSRLFTLLTTLFFVFSTSVLALLLATLADFRNRNPKRNSNPTSPELPLSMSLLVTGTMLAVFKYRYPQRLNWLLPCVVTATVLLVVVFREEASGLWIDTRSVVSGGAVDLVKIDDLRFWLCLDPNGGHCPEEAKEGADWPSLGAGMILGVKLLRLLGY